MFYTFLLVLLVIVSVLLIAVILLQAGKGSGLAASFGGASSSPDAFIGTRQAGTLLTKASWWGTGLFLFLSFVLQLMSTRASAPRSVLEGRLGAPPAAAPSQSPSANPAVPLQPLPAAPTPAPRTPQR